MALSFSQNKFLAERLNTRTDREAAALAQISEQSIQVWKRTDAEFVEEYENLGKDGIELAKNIARQHLGKAMLTLIEACEANQQDRAGGERPDWDARINAAKQILAVHKVGNTTVDAELTGKLIVEVVRIGGSSKADSSPPT